MLYSVFWKWIKVRPSVDDAGYAGQYRIIDIVVVFVRVSCPTKTQTDRPRQTHQDRQTETDRLRQTD